MKNVFSPIQKRATQHLPQSWARTKWNMHLRGEIINVKWIKKTDGHHCVKENTPAHQPETVKVRLLGRGPPAPRSFFHSCPLTLDTVRVSQGLSSPLLQERAVRPSFSTVSLHWNMWHITETSPSLCGMVFYLWVPKGHRRAAWCCQRADSPVLFSASQSDPLNSPTPRAPVTPTSA